MQRLFAGMSLRGRTVLEALRQREDLIAQLEGFLTDYDVWVCPVSPGPAFTHRPPTAPIDVDGYQVSQLRANLLHTIIFNVIGNPVVTLPVGRTVAGLPVGVQMVGRRSEEWALLAAAERIAGLTAGYQPPPAVV
jgi:amidase